MTWFLIWYAFGLGTTAGEFRRLSELNHARLELIIGLFLVPLAAFFGPFYLLTESKFCPRCGKPMAVKIAGLTLMRFEH